MRTCHHMPWHERAYKPWHLSQLAWPFHSWHDMLFQWDDTSTPKDNMSLRTCMLAQILHSNDMTWVPQRQHGTENMYAGANISFQWHDMSTPKTTWHWEHVCWCKVFALVFDSGNCHWQNLWLMGLIPGQIRMVSRPSPHQSRSHAGNHSSPPLIKAAEASKVPTCGWLAGGNIPKGWRSQTRPWLKLLLISMANCFLTFNCRIKNEAWLWLTQRSPYRSKPHTSAWSCRGGPALQPPFVLQIYCPGAQRVLPIGTLTAHTPWTWATTRM